jgi:dethiobiotin synthetase/adenosylmethionine--8-amino-7-oxononanoate aminotransferase
MVFENHRYGNDAYLRAYFDGHGISTVTLPQPPQQVTPASEDEKAMAAYYENSCDLEAVQDLVTLIFEKHQARIDNLQTMAKRAKDSVWHPFTQHQLPSSGNILTIDSAYGDFFQILNTPALEASTGLSTNSVQPDQPHGRVASHNLLQPAFDGSASWWTQGLGHGNPALSLTAAYAAGRYGHVMFAGAIHEPAIRLAEFLLQNLNNPLLRKVFFTDNGSTGMEVAVKMALRAACNRYGWNSSSDDVLILGLKGSYHGDTIGVMNCSEPSTFNKKTDWYRPFGYWFDIPQVKMRKGVWIVEPPAGMEPKLGQRTTYATLDEIFDFKTRSSCSYEKYIKNTLTKLIQEEGKRFGALVMEPVILGAGGMHFV